MFLTVSNLGLRVVISLQHICLKFVLLNIHSSMLWLKVHQFLEYSAHNLVIETLIRLSQYSTPKTDQKSHEARFQQEYERLP